MYNVNDIIRYDSHWEQAARYCNQNDLQIVELSPDECGRRFQIQTRTLPTAQQLIEAKIEELKQNLYNTDYKALKYAEGLYTEEEYAETKAQRQAWRDQINELEKQLN